MKYKATVYTKMKNGKVKQRTYHCDYSYLTMRDFRNVNKNFSNGDCSVRWVGDKCIVRDRTMNRKVVYHSFVDTRKNKK